LARGTGSAKKFAEQDAARRARETLDREAAAEASGVQEEETAE
jgi:hypothetical protein